jgi:outer membrane protein OmpA-like peptidoglycan-associated protein
MKFKSKNLNRLFYTLPAMMLTFSIAAQEGENLVNNPSFEDAQSRKLRRLGDIERAEAWISATGDRADLFSAEANMPDIMTPENVFGKEEPKDGINYAGIITYSYREKENRTYLTTQLTTPMKKGMRYKVQFYASLGELSKYSANRLGAHFSKKPIGTDEKIPAIILNKEEVHIEHPKQEPFDGMFGWDLVCGEYLATGKEKFMTIGNFSLDADIKTERVRKPRDIKGTQIIAAYYYIDDVSVQLLGPNETCNCNYADEAKVQTSTVYQRSPEITKEMTAKERIAELSIYYMFGRYDVKMDGDKTLERIALLMEENPDMKIQITGHSDAEEASNPAEKVVSLRRAEYIRTLLGEKGISEDRFIIEDAKDGETSKHILEDDDEKLKAAKSRRVSFKAL